MDSRLFAALPAALVLAAALASAQTLSPTGSAPTLDGIVAAKEYSLSLPVGKITLSASRTADTVYLAVSAPTTGWVSVGLGSELMDGAQLFLGYVAGGKPSFTQQLGSGHGHSELAKPLEVRDALRETGGVTFASYHLARGSVKLQL